MRNLAGLLAILTLLFHHSARADKLMPADPWELIHIAREHGPAEVGRDTLRDPLITAEAAGVPYQIAFYGCHLGRDCETILFRSALLHPRWRRGHPKPGLITEWNEAKLFGRAVRGDSGQAILEHPLAIGPGMPWDAMRASFQAWRNALAEFAEHVDFKR